MQFETTVTPARAASMRAQGWWQEKTIKDYFRDALRAYPAKTALVASVQGAAALRRISYSELDALAASVAASLRAIGVGHGDVVSMQLPNIWEFVVLAFAASRIGAVVNPLMPILREAELANMLEFCEAKVLIVPARYRGHDHAAMARSLLPQLPQLKRLVVVGEDGPDGFTQALLSPATPALDGGAAMIEADEVTLLMVSSGTTGAPKGVMHTSNTLLSTLRTSIKDLHLTSDDVVLARVAGRAPDGLCLPDHDTADSGCGHCPDGCVGTGDGVGANARRESDLQPRSDNLSGRSCQCRGRRRSRRADTTGIDRAGDQGHEPDGLFDLGHDGTDGWHFDTDRSGTCTVGRGRRTGCSWQ